MINRFPNLKPFKTGNLSKLSIVFGRPARVACVVAGEVVVEVQVDGNRPVGGGGNDCHRKGRWPEIPMIGILPTNI